MIITVDGLDGSGKSTLAKALANRLGFKYIDKPLYQLFNVSGDDNILYEPLCQMQDAIYNKTSSDKLKAWFTGMSLLYIKEECLNKNIVIDRGILSCYAYNGNTSSDQVFQYLIDLGIWFDVSILLYVSPEVRKKRLFDRNPNDSDLTFDKIMNLKYDSVNSFLAQHPNLPIIRIDTDNLTSNEVLESAVSLLKKQFGFSLM